MVLERYFQNVYYDNLGLSYNSGTGVFTILGSNGRSLSNSNPSILFLPSVSNPGQFTRYRLTSNQSFQDAAGTSDITGNLFGTTTGVSWVDNMPFFIYAVPNDAEDSVAFMISRTPARTESPVAAKIAQSGDTNATTQGSFFSLRSITAADYDGNPCVCIGSFRMTKDSSNDWTVTTLDSAQDGFGLFQENVVFRLGSGQNGAASGTYILDNGGTAPVFSIDDYGYRVQKNGLFLAGVYLTGDGGANGAGAVTSLIVFPYVVKLPLVTGGVNSVYGYICRVTTSGSGIVIRYPFLYDEEPYFSLGDDGLNPVQNQDFSGLRTIQTFITTTMSND